jgi:hypothetical protein
MHPQGTFGDRQILDVFGKAIFFKPFYNVRKKTGAPLKPENHLGAIA